jgi:Carboxypeptidase regulatory-like domain
MKGRSIFSILCLCITLMRPLAAQVASSTTLVGTVTDTSGAAVPGARVVAVQDATKASYKGVTSGTGDYTLPYVAVGTYTITVDAGGFQRVVHTNVSIEVNHTVRSDFALPLGAVTDQVIVSDAPPAIATDDAALVQTLSSTTISSLPVVGHDALQLALTSAGVQLSSNVTVGDPPGEAFAGPGYRGEQQDVSLDGVTLMNSIHVTVDFPPSPDALQEFSCRAALETENVGNGVVLQHLNRFFRTFGARR